MAKSRKPDPDDIELFRRSVGQVRKVNNDRVQHRQQRPAPRPRLMTDDEIPLADPGFPEAPGGLDVSADDSLFFARSGLQNRLLQRLRRSQLPVGAELDMHGMTIPVARNEIARFIAHCCDRHIRCARIIHGKGYGSRADAPVLKNRLNNWLRQHHDVLAFTSTPRDAGGTGAIYVLLRSRR
ncbi:MAG: Smr/MutS family protein [Pseudomonadota bacterium]